MSNRFIPLLAIITVFAFGQEASPAPVDGPLKSAIEDYSRGDIFSAARQLESVLPELQGDDLLAAEKYLAFSYARMPNRDQADKHFRALLKARPKWRPDPAETSPEIEELFWQTKRDMTNEAGVCSCFIPGFGQMMKGENKKGIVLLAASSSTFIWGITSWMITDQRHRDYLAVVSTDTVRLNRAYDQYNNWHHVSMVSIAAFIAVYGFTVYDAYHVSAAPRTALIVKNIRIDYAGLGKTWRVGYETGF